MKSWIVKIQCLENLKKKKHLSTFFSEVNISRPELLLCCCNNHNTREIFTSKEKVCAYFPGAMFNFIHLLEMVCLWVILYFQMTNYLYYNPIHFSHQYFGFYFDTFDEQVSVTHTYWSKRSYHIQKIWLKCSKQAAQLFLPWSHLHRCFACCWRNTGLNTCHLTVKWCAAASCFVQLLGRVR